MPFIDEEIENYEPGVDSGNDPQYSKYVMDKVRLSQRMDQMEPEKKRLLVKTIQFKILKEILAAIKNLKGTTAETWKRIMRKLEAITGIDIGQDKSGFDFNAMARVLLPLLGALAGTMIAFKAAQKAESEAASPREDPDDPTAEVNTPEYAEAQLNKIYNDFVNKSVVMQMCDGKENGFSTDGSEPNNQ